MIVPNMGRAALAASLATSVRASSRCAAAAERGTTSVFEVDHAGCCAVYEMDGVGNATVSVATAHGRLSGLWRVGWLARAGQSCPERPV